MAGGVWVSSAFQGTFSLRLLGLSDILSGIGRKLPSVAPAELSCSRSADGTTVEEAVHIKGHDIPLDERLPESTYIDREGCDNISLFDQVYCACPGLERESRFETKMEVMFSSTSCVTLGENFFFLATRLYPF